MNIKTKVLLIVIAVLITALVIIIPAFALEDLWIVQAVAKYNVYPQLGEHWDCRVVSVTFDASIPGWAATMFCERYDNVVYLPVVGVE